MTAISYKYMENKTVIWVLISTMICIIIALGGVTFRTPDDYLISGIYAGYYGGGWNAILIPYIHFFWGAFAYAISLLCNCPIGWGAILLLLLNCTFINLHISVDKQGNGIIGHLIVCVLQIVIGGLYLTYTIVAYLLSGSSIMLLSLLDRGKTDSGYIRRFANLGVVSGILLRPQIISTVLLLLIPSIRKNKNKRSLIAILLVTLLLIASNEIMYFYNPIWREYKDWNNACTMYRDYRINWDDLRMSGKLENADLYENDIEMIVNWDYADNNFFDLETLRTVANAVPIRSRYKIDLMKLVSDYLNDKIIISVIFFSLLCIGICLRKETTINVLFSLVMTSLLIMALYVRKRYVDRVYIPIYIIGLFQILFGLDFAGRRWKKSACIVFMSLCLLWGGKESLRERIDEMELQPNIELYNYIHNNKMTFVVNSSVANNIWQNKAIIKLNQEDYPVNMIKTGSWDTFSGRYYYIAKNNNISPDSLFMDLTNYSTIALITNDEIEAERINTFIKDHYNYSATYEMIEFNNDFNVYRYSK